MSAYGTITTTFTTTALSTTLWPTKSHSQSTPSYLTLHHLNRARAQNFPGLIECMHSAFAHIIDEGATYPQETLQGEAYTREAFEAYFLGGDLILGITGSDASLGQTSAGESVELDVDAARAGREWEECVAGFYYVSYDLFFPRMLKIRTNRYGQVKPNYPGRSSHVRHSSPS
jgi:hypothetical protein